MDISADVIILGGGIAGASAAFFLAPHASVVLLEAEEQFGQHSSGRSAAQFTVGITAPAMRRLAAASRAFLAQPPAGFAASPLLHRRGSLTFGRAGDEARLDALARRIREAGAQAKRLDMAGTLARFPLLLAASAAAGAVEEPDAMEIEVDALLQGYLRGARAHGARCLGAQRVLGLHHEAQGWEVRTQAAAFRAPRIVNAAGAWVDEVAALAGVQPIGIQPYRRTAFTFAPPPGLDHTTWPHVADIGGRWYVQPDAGQMMGSLADTTPCPPCDAMPEEFDIALAIDRIGADTRLQIGRPTHRWAGLRSFVHDRDPVAGEAPDTPGFFWLAGQGGCGVLTSPALGEAAAALVLGRAWPEALRAAGLVPASLAPSRLA